ncbi:zinc ribbon domain-containing protein, partial [Mycobacterium sp. E136]|uniref:double zinc ribbon domain-containing protein n=1 Tax=Mycobacterium sp. E136 TaxID=1834125 RepID=UPI000AB7B971
MAEDRRTCASCGTANEEDARFCEGCGGSLARVCATCGLEARATARFCRGCGAPLDELAAPATEVPIAGPARKTVTVMFADLAGSTTFEERVDAETAREVIGHYHELLRSTAQRHRAGVTKYIGDLGGQVDEPVLQFDRGVDGAQRVLGADLGDTPDGHEAVADVLGDA